MPLQTDTYTLFHHGRVTINEHFYKPPYSAFFSSWNCLLKQLKKEDGASFIFLALNSNDKRTPTLLIPLAVISANKRTRTVLILTPTLHGNSKGTHGRL